jgi:carboxymethylenebutenolidase
MSSKDEMDAELAPDHPGRRRFVKTLLASGFALAVQPVSARTIVTDGAGLNVATVKIPTLDRAIPAYCAMPEKGGPFATVVVVPEIFGVHEHIRDLCRRLAKKGYLAVAPDLFVRQGDVMQIKDIKQIMDGIIAKVPDAQALADLDATLAWAQTASRGDGRRIGMTGFCWGGRIAWLYAAHNPKLKAAVVWYGRLVTPPTALQPGQPLDVVPSLKVPVLGLYGGADEGIPLNTIQQMQEALKSAGGSSEIEVYPDTPHGFNADYRPTYREAAAKQAWQHMLDWLQKHGVD